MKVWVAHTGRAGLTHGKRLRVQKTYGGAPRSGRVSPRKGSLRPGSPMHIPQVAPCTSAPAMAGLPRF